MDFFSTYRPCEELQDVVELYWRSKCDLEQSLVQEMYTPTFQALTFNLGGYYEDIVSESGSIKMDKDCYLIGQPLSKRVSLSNPAGIDILGVQFTPLGLFMLTGIDMRHIADQVIDASDVWNREVAYLYEQILSKGTISEQISMIELFLIRKRREGRNDEKVRTLRNTLYLMEQKKIYSVAKLRESTFTTKKTLERYFLNHIGVSPKQYANISRFNSVRAYLDNPPRQPDWHEIIEDFGYHDQSHLIREFKRYAGKTPAEYHSQISCAATPGAESNLMQIFA